MSFRENLLYLRSKNNMTQEQLAEMLGVSRQSVAKWESERSYPEIDKLVRISKIFGCTLDDLVTGDLLQQANEQRPSTGVTDDGDDGDVAGNDTGSYMESAANIPAGESTHNTPAYEAAESIRKAAVATPATDEHGYDRHMRSFALRIATGVAFIIAGVAFCTLFAEPTPPRSASAVEPGAIALASLLVGIIIGLSCIIPATISHSSFVRRHPVLRDFYSFEQKRAAGQQLAVGIVGGIALIFSGILVEILLFEETVAGVFTLLVFIAVAVWVFIWTGIRYSRVHIREYNKESLDEISSNPDDASAPPLQILEQLSPDERTLLFESEDIDPNDPEAISEFFTVRKRKGSLVRGVCGIIMLMATIAGLCLLFGVPVQSELFWMAWVIGGISCGIVCIVIETFGQ